MHTNAACARPHRGQRRKAGIFPLLLSDSCLETGSLIEFLVYSLGEAGWPEALGICLSLPHKVGVIGKCSHAHLFWRVVRLRSHAAEHALLTTKSSPQTLINLLF